MSSHILSLRNLATIGAIFSLTLTVGCTPIADKRGYVRDEPKIESIQVGVDNKESVYQRLGSPSTSATLSMDVWYYITSREERFGFFAPKATFRDITAVAFDEEDYVADIADYGLEDGKVVSYVGRKTPTRGKELTFLEQMFGNIGRLPAPNQQQGP